MNLFHEAKKVLDKDGKVNPLGPYGKQKLTGQEVASYFKKNRVSDSKVKRAVEVALDMGGAMDIAAKEIKNFFGDKILKSKEVQSALKYANEEVVSEAKIQDIARKHKRELQKIQKSGNLELSKKAEDDLYQWASNNGEIHGDEEDEFWDWIDTNVDDLVKGRIREETIDENYRVLAKHGMGTETKNSIKVGTEIDYYRADGAKYMGKVTKMSAKDYIVKDDKNGKNYKFTYHDRVKAKKYLKQGDNIQEKVEYAEYKFRNKRDAQKALDYFKSQQLIKLEINDDGLSHGELAIDAGKYDMSKYHKEVLKKFKPKVLTTEMASAQQAAIAIAKKKKNESVMDSYRDMWEQSLDEAVITYRVKGMQKPEMDKFKGASRMGLKVSFKKSGSDTHVTLTGTKKNLRDFDSVARGKSSYGDPSTITHFDEK